MMSYLISFLIGAGVVVFLGALFYGAIEFICKKYPDEQNGNEPSCETKEENIRLEPRLVAYAETSGKKAEDKYTYVGVNDCAICESLAGGLRADGEACLGLGSCARVCPVGAISVDSGACEVDKEKCTACGECIKACPRGIIKLVEYKEESIEEEITEETAMQE